LLKRKQKIVSRRSRKCWNLYGAHGRIIEL
jgi:hypothetical protein